MSKIHTLQFHIDGAWVAPAVARTIDVINPATEAVIGQVSIGSVADVDRAVAAARAAFPAFAATSREERVALLSRIIDIYKRRFNEMGATICEEMGAPLAFATKFQAGAGMGHFRTALDILKTFAFEQTMGTTQVVREPIGVAGMITPWNWPANQIACKIAPAIATGCTMVLKPSEVAPYSALLLAEILEEAGVPKGVFNLVNGDGPGVGAAIAGHPDIDVISFTGSTKAGIDVAIKAAPTVKRVGQELGGKSANIILDDADLTPRRDARRAGLDAQFRSVVHPPSRMLVSAAKLAEATALAKAVTEKMKVGDPNAADTEIGPVVSKVQWDKIQALIASGIKDGARIATGGAGLPAGLTRAITFSRRCFRASTTI